jgi:hypothetical protein
MDEQDCELSSNLPSYYISDSVFNMLSLVIGALYLAVILLYIIPTKSRQI